MRVLSRQMLESNLRWLQEMGDEEQAHTAMKETMTSAACQLPSSPPLTSKYSRKYHFAAGVSIVVGGLI